jgi:hypothetical protein
MAECLADKIRNPLGKYADKFTEVAQYTLDIPRDERGDMDKKTGQIIVACEVEGCSAELEVYPSPFPGEYDVARSSLQAARYVCRRAQVES